MDLRLKATTREKRRSFAPGFSSCTTRGQSLIPSKAAKFYAKDANLTFFDIAPMKYTGWNEYAAGVPKAFADYKSGKFTVGDDLQVHRHGNLTWATCTWTGDLTKKDDTLEKAAGRYTVVFEKRGKDWLIVHEHMSAPLGAPAK